MKRVKLPPGEYVDLYDATGIAVGTKIKTINITPNDIQLYFSANKPETDDVNLPLMFGRGSAFNDAGDAGAWAKCVSGGAVHIEVIL